MFNAGIADKYPQKYGQYEPDRKKTKEELNNQYYKFIIKAIRREGYKPDRFNRSQKSENALSFRALEPGQKPKRDWFRGHQIIYSNHVIEENNWLKTL